MATVVQPLSLDRGKALGAFLHFPASHQTDRLFLTKLQQETDNPGNKFKEKIQVFCWSRLGFPSDFHGSFSKRLICSVRASCFLCGKIAWSFTATLFIFLFAIISSDTRTRSHRVRRVLGLFPSILCNRVGFIIPAQLGLFSSSSHVNWVALALKTYFVRYGRQLLDLCWWESGRLLSFSTCWTR